MSNEINRDEMNDLLEELKLIYGDLREKYFVNSASNEVKNDFEALDKMVSNFFGYDEMILEEYLENLSDFTTGLYYLEIDLGLGNSEQMQIYQFMTLLNSFTNRCVYKYSNLFKQN